MAKIRPGDAAALAPVTRRLTPPGVFLLRMTIFLTLVGFLAAILFDQLKRSFLNNPGLNGLIVGALLLARRSRAQRKQRENARVQEAVEQALRKQKTQTP